MTPPHLPYTTLEQADTLPFSLKKLRTGDIISLLKVKVMFAQLSW